MSYQPLPYAKRQKLTFDSPNLRPPPAVEPVFFEPSDFSAPTSHSLTNNNSHHHPKQSKSRPPIHGNFFGYYTRRWADPNELDPRLALLPKEWIEGKKVLDVGCNSGMVTVEIAQRFQPWRVTGVDIDDELIRLAKRHGESRSCLLRRRVQRDLEDRGS
jgi:7SK snRNA methylphosphate capping enzyme